MTDTAERRVVSIYAQALTPTDGVADHVHLLSSELVSSGYSSEVIAVDWHGRGWSHAMRSVDAVARHSPQLLVLHYSHLAWSRRGLPIGLIRVVLRARRLGPVLLWVHDPGRIDGRLPRQRLASAAKAAGLWAASRLSAATVLTVHPSRVYWMRLQSHTTYFCPSPTNISSPPPTPPPDIFTVACFGIGLTSQPFVIARLRLIARRLTERIGPFRLRIVGSNEPIPRASLDYFLKLGVTVDVVGELNSRETGERLAAAHVFLHIRGPVTSRSGTLAAAMACGLPVVGMSGEETGPPLDAGALFLVEADDIDAAADALAVLARDDDKRAQLSAASKSVAAAHYSWQRARTIVDEVMANVGAQRAASRTRAQSRRTTTFTGTSRLSRQVGGQSVRSALPPGRRGS